MGNTFVYDLNTDKGYGERKFVGGEGDTSPKI
jgi:hypothetical protein